MQGFPGMPGEKGQKGEPGLAGYVGLPGPRGILSWQVPSWSELKRVKPVRERIDRIAGLCGIWFN